MEYLLTTYNFLNTHSSKIAEIAIVIAAMAGFSVIYFSSKIARRRATVDMIRSFEVSEDHYEHHGLFIKLCNKNLKKDGEILTQYATLDTQSSKEAAAIRYMLNHYEFMAVGIKQGILCEYLYSMWYYSTVIKHYNCTKLYIGAVRQNGGSDDYYIEFEKLAEKWKECEHPSKPGMIQLAYWRYNKKPLIYISFFGVLLIASFISGALIY